MDVSNRGQRLRELIKEVRSLEAYISDASGSSPFHAYAAASRLAAVKLERERLEREGVALGEAVLGHLLLRQGQKITPGAREGETVRGGYIGRSDWGALENLMSRGGFSRVIPALQRQVAEGMLEEKRAELLALSDAKGPKNYPAIERVRAERDELKLALERGGQGYPLSVLRAAQDLMRKGGTVTLAGFGGVNLSTLNSLIGRLRFADGDPALLEVRGVPAGQDVYALAARAMVDAKEAGLITGSLRHKDPEAARAVARSEGRLGLEDPAIEARIRRLCQDMRIGDLMDYVRETGLRRKGLHDTQASDPDHPAFVARQRALLKEMAAWQERFLAARGDAPPNLTPAEALLYLQREAKERLRAAEADEPRLKEIQGLIASLRLDVAALAEQARNALDTHASEAAFRVAGALIRRLEEASKEHAAGHEELRRVAEHAEHLRGLTAAYFGKDARADSGSPLPASAQRALRENATIDWSMPSSPGDYELTRGKWRGRPLRDAPIDYLLDYLEPGAPGAARAKLDFGAHGQVDVPTGGMLNEKYVEAVAAVRAYFGSHEGRTRAERYHTESLARDEASGGDRPGTSQAKDMEDRSRRENEARRTVKTGYFGALSLLASRRAELNRLERELPFEGRLRGPGAERMYARLERLRGEVESLQKRVALGPSETSAHSGADYRADVNARARQVYQDHLAHRLEEGDPHPEAERKAREKRDHFLSFEMTREEALSRGESPERAARLAKRALKQATLHDDPSHDSPWHTPSALSMDLRDDSRSRREAREIYEQGLERHEGDIWRDRFRRYSRPQLLRFAIGVPIDTPEEDISHSERNRARAILSQAQARHDPEWRPSPGWRRGALEYDEATGESGDFTNKGAYTQLDLLRAEAEALLGHEEGIDPDKLTELRARFARLFQEEHRIEEGAEVPPNYRPRADARTREEMHRYLEHLYEHGSSLADRGRRDLGLASLPPGEPGDYELDTELVHDTQGRARSYFTTLTNPLAAEVHGMLREARGRLDFRDSQAAVGLTAPPAEIHPPPEGRYHDFAGRGRAAGGPPLEYYGTSDAGAHADPADSESVEARRRARDLGGRGFNRPLTD